jgi:alpha-amylase
VLAARAARAQGSLAAPLPQETAPAWTVGATCYELFVRSFKDSDGDGIGDLNGLISKLDYINDGNPRSTRSLGARCIWLMPVDESPSYHGYDVSDYYRVARALGTNDDFKRMVAAAHDRGIRVLVDLVLNHSSDQHPHFQEALRDSASPYRAWYRWSPTDPGRGPWGSDIWHKSPLRDEYYYGIFSSHMPDLNYETPAVLEEAKHVAEYWLDSMHVDGFRLDAVSYLVEDGMHLAHTAGTHRVLREWQAYVRGVKPDVFTVGEVTYPNDTVLTYYPDQLTSYFAFEVADSIIAAVRSGSAKGMLAPVMQLQRTVPNGRWSPFVRNHDQVRTRTELGGDIAKAKIAATLLLTMPGMPFVYYGEEIGMSGAKPDERLRTPMQWSSAHGDGFTTGTPWEQLQRDSLTTTVAAEERDAGSILALHRRLIHLRDRCAALAAGEIVPLETSSEAVAAYLRVGDNEAVLVIANLSDSTLSGVVVGEPVPLITIHRGQMPPLKVGRWSARDLLGREKPASLAIGGGGRMVGYAPLNTLSPKRAYVLALSRDSKNSCSP